MDTLNESSTNDTTAPFIAFNSYAIRKTGIVQSSTYIRIENYYLISIPWKISCNEMLLLVSLNTKERALFQKYLNTPCSVFMSCSNGKSKEEIKLLIQSTIRNIGPVANRENMCCIQLSIRSCPDLLKEIIDDYLRSFQAVRNSFSTLAGKKVQLDSTETAKLMGFNNYAEIQQQGREIPVRILSLAVDALEFVVSSVHGSFADQSEFSLKLYFIQNRFAVNGRRIDAQPYGNIYVKVSLELDFCPDLVDVLDLYFAVSNRKNQPEVRNIVNGTPIAERVEEFEELEKI